MLIKKILSTQEPYHIFMGFRYKEKYLRAGPYGPRLLKKSSLHKNLTICLWASDTKKNTSAQDLMGFAY